MRSHVRYAIPGRNGCQIVQVAQRAGQFGGEDRVVRFIKIAAERSRKRIGSSPVPATVSRAAGGIDDRRGPLAAMAGERAEPGDLLAAFAAAAEPLQLGRSRARIWRLGGGRSFDRGVGIAAEQRLRWLPSGGCKVLDRAWSGVRRPGGPDRSARRRQSPAGH